MPSDQEAAEFLWVCLKHTKNTINWNKVGNELNLVPATANMRMTRLRAAVKRGDAIPGDSKRFLWACITTDTESNVVPIDFNQVAAELKLKKGTATMRMTRLRLQMKAECSSSPTKTPSASPTKVAPVTPSKRSAKPAATPSKKVKATPSKNVKADESEADSDVAFETPTARAYSTPSRSVKRNVSYADSSASSEVEGSDSDTFEPDGEKAKKKGNRLGSSPSPSNGDILGRSCSPSNSTGATKQHQSQLPSEPLAEPASIDKTYTADNTANDDAVQNLTKRSKTPQSSRSAGGTPHKSIFSDGLVQEEPATIDTIANIFFAPVEHGESRFHPQTVEVEDYDDEWAV